MIPSNLVGDFAGGGLYLNIGILAALRGVSATGLGQVVDSSVLDGVIHMQASAMSLANAGLLCEERGSNITGGGCPFYALYETADGGHMAVGALGPKFFALLLGVDFPVTSQYDRARWPELGDILRAAFLNRSREGWVSVFGQSDACVAPVLRLSEIRRHPQVDARTAVGGGGRPAARRCAAILTARSAAGPNPWIWVGSSSLETFAWPERET